MASIEFSSIKEELQQAIYEKLKDINAPKDFLGFTIFEGFINLSIEQELDKVTLGGPRIPVVAIMGRSTGQMHFYPLKTLLPHIELN